MKKKKNLKNVVECNFDCLIFNKKVVKIHIFKEYYKQEKKRMNEKAY